jgi:O-antigen/teichoic acid export membrane protein
VVPLLGAVYVTLSGFPEGSDVARRVLLDPDVRAPGSSAVVWRSGPPIVVSPATEAAPPPSVLGEARDEASVEPACTGDVLCDEIAWATAPPVGPRVRLAAEPGWRVLVRAGGDPLLLSRGRTFVLALRADDPRNLRFRLWPYFNYLLRALSSRSAGEQPPRFSRWPLSPVPHRGLVLFAVPLLAALWAGTGLLFFRARRAARRHPGSLRVPAGHDDERSAAWARPGFARPLAGLLTLCGAMLVLCIPYFWLTNVAIPNRVQPFPEAKGAWEWCWETLQVVRFLFDAGTFVAFVKYFAEYRVKDPGEALRSAQFFVWWQIGTGLLQLTLAVVAATTALSNTRYAWAGHLVLLNGVVEYPGFFGMFTFLFMAAHRYDLNIGLDLLSDWLLRHAVAIPIVLLARAWGRAHPVYGESFAAALGLGVGYSVANVLVFGIGVVLARRLGFALRPLFLAGFGLATAKRMLWYGARVVAGQAVFRAAKSIEGVVLSLLLVNYTYWLGIRGQIYWHLTFLFPMAYRAFETATAALSESYGNGKLRLTQYYVVRFLQVGSLYAAIVMSFLGALGAPFVRAAMDAQWHAAAGFVVLAAAAELLDAPAWLSDMLEKGAGRPGLFAWVLTVEQALRVGLFALFIPRYQIAGLYYGIVATITLKCVLAWWLNHRLIVPLRLYPHAMFVAPALGGMANWALLCAAARVLPSGGAWPVALFFGGGVLSFASVPFLVGLFGGFDRGFLQELDEAAGMVPLVRPFARLIERAARAGARRSPLFDRYPVTLRDEALSEAAELEQAQSVSRR